MVVAVDQLLLHGPGRHYRQASGCCQVALVHLAGDLVSWMLGATFMRERYVTKRNQKRMITKMGK